MIVWNQEGEDDIHNGLTRTRISCAVSRNDGGIWEFHQNVESILEGTVVVPGPIQPTIPQAMFTHKGTPALECNSQVSMVLPKNMGRWSYPSVLVMEDHVLIAHTYSSYAEPDKYPAGTARIKVLPLSWFYGGADPRSEQMKTNIFLKKVDLAATP